MNSIIDAFDWKNLRSAESSEGLPKALSVIATSSNESELGKAYWAIDNESVVQGCLFESAYAVSVCLIAIMSTCKAEAKKYVLELLVQFASGIPDASELNYGNANIKKKICEEILMSKQIFFEVLNVGSEAEKILAIDIIGLCSMENHELKEIAIDEFKKIKRVFREINADNFIENWIVELEGSVKRSG